MHKSIVTSPLRGPRNSGDFDFRSSQSRVESPPCGDTRLVKSPQIAPVPPGTSKLRPIPKALMCTLNKSHVFLCFHIRCWICFWKGFAVFFSLLAQPKILVCRFSYCFGHMHTWINFSKQNHRISLGMRGHLEGQNKAHFPRYHRYSPGPGVGSGCNWLVQYIVFTTNATKAF